jgi:predicted dehydrogenase
MKRRILTAKKGHFSAASRREFLRGVAGSTAAAWAVPAIVRGRNLNERLNIAVIACGGRGLDNLRGVGSENVVALCDVYEPAVARAAEGNSDAIRCTDFRRLFDDHANRFDAVVVSTPEHTHAFATLTALRLGKHVYCEKPLTRDIYEARVIREAAAKTNVATQMGTQNHAKDVFRQVVELIQSGAIGPVREAHVWVSRAWGWQSAEEATANKDIVSVRERPEGSTPTPSGLDWDLWIGPAPARPYHEVYWPGPKWYRWWDFGNGTMSDLGSHRVDLPFLALELKAPLTVTAEGPPPHPELAPASMRVVYEYGPRGQKPPVRLTWYQGTPKPEVWTRGEIPQWPDGVVFIGDDGMLVYDGRKFVLQPEDKFRDFKGPDPFLPRVADHYAEWIAACKTGSTTGSNFEYAGWLTEANHLGNVAYRTGTTLEWDPTGMRAPNAPEADRYIRREYRGGWSLA